MKKGKIVQVINDQLKLKDSISKLRWYIREKTNFYELYTSVDVLPEELMNRLKYAVEIIEGGLLNKEDILSQANDKLIHPLKVISGVYFLIRNTKIVYVGSAKNLLLRLGGHFYKEKDFNKIFFLEVHDSEIRKIESFYIWFLKPSYNKNAGENDFIVRELLSKSNIL